MPSCHQLGVALLLPHPALVTALCFGPVCLPCGYRYRHMTFHSGVLASDLQRPGWDLGFHIDGFRSKVDTAIGNKEL